MGSAGSSIHGRGNEDGHDGQHDGQRKQIVPLVVVSSDDEGEVEHERVTHRRQRRRRRPRARVARLHSPLRSEVFTISSNSGEGEDMGVSIQPTLQSFRDLNIGQTSPIHKQPIAMRISPNLVTVEVQTEISILPHIFLEPSVVNMVINSARDVPVNQAVSSPPWVLQKPFEDTPPAAAETDVTCMTKMIFGHPYEVAISSDPCLDKDVASSSVFSPQ